MCKIQSLDQIPNKEVFLPIDNNGREISIYHLKNCVVTGKSLYYPNPLLYSLDNSRVYRPIKEKIMSLEKLESASTIQSPTISVATNEDTNVFYFIYNTDNYYHFLYDTLPYLITFNHLKKTMKIKLLMNFPNHQKSEFYKFVIEFLELFGVTQDDILMVDGQTLYKNIYLSTSYTHDINSNLPPREEVYPFYKTISNILPDSDVPKKIYVSRRTWLHNDTTNIGTNYTQKRVMVNETELVEYLTSIGYSEIFTENLSTIEKIQMFKNATDVVGAFGGGISNVLFSNCKCNLTAICSPSFLNVNQRFVHSLSRVNLNIFDNTFHHEKGEFLKFMRVKYHDIVGEVADMWGTKLVIHYLTESVAGWNSNMKYNEIIADASLCTKLDDGLNSAWVVDLNKFKNIVK